MPQTPANGFCLLGVPKPEFGIEETVDMYINQQYTFTDGRGTIDYPISSSSGEPYTHYIDNTPVHSSSREASVWIPPHF